MGCAVDRVCEKGSCVCLEGLTDCGVVCIDAERDVANCGGCGKACPWGASCEKGACVCPSGTTLCDDTCVDTDSHPAHCGACVQPCMDLPNAVDPVCQVGECRFDCAFGFADCDGDWETGCETPVFDDPQRCGACNQSCEDLPWVESATCFMASCHIEHCAPGRANCDLDPTTGCETETSSNPEHCGGCGISCRSLGRVENVSCEEGECIYTCEEGWEDCDGDPANGCEADLLHGTTGHCGTCEETCGPMEYCWEGGCAADPVFANWPIPPVGAQSFDTSKAGITRDPITGLEWESSPPTTAIPFLQAEGYCEHLDLDGLGWRVPSPIELQSIIDYSRSSPAIDTTAFPGTATGYYWTSHRDLSSTASIWVFNFGSGTAASFTTDRPVRCVRGGHRVEGERYRVESDIVEDRVTGLVWQRDAPVDRVLIPEAQSGCAALRLEGRSDWRLPNIKELMSIFLPTTTDRIDTAVFTGSSPTFWSGTSTPGGNILYVNFGGGNTLIGSASPDSSTVARRYRCVRDADGK